MPLKTRGRFVFFFLKRRPVKVTGGVDGHVGQGDKETPAIRLLGRQKGAKG